MEINATNVITETYIIIFFLICTIVFTVRKRNESGIFPLSITNELKGLAILMIIFSHLGYFLFSDHRFLYPVSTMAGVGVNIFLFLSGYGLSISQNKNKLSIIKQYSKRLFRLFIPMWVSLVLFVCVDKIILNKIYPTETIIKYSLGFVQSNDIFTDLNSPLWFFSLVLFYYLIFPVFYKYKFPVLSAIVIFIFSIIIINLPIPVNSFILKNYKLHIVAFPLGIIFSYLISKYGLIIKIKNYFLVNQNKLSRQILKGSLMTLLVIIIGYLAINSSVSERIIIEEFVSTVSVLLILLLFLIKPFKISFLELLGTYSFEIYLLHWPIFSRYSYLYSIFPASVATILYMLIILILSVGMKKLIDDQILSRLRM